jgi:cytidylate kinase
MMFPVMLDKLRNKSQVSMRKRYMGKDLPFVITISRQLGSGGAYLGQQLATHLNIMYLDREILFHAAQELNISEADLRSRDEMVTPRWQAWIEAISHGYTQAYVPPMTDFLPTDQALFDAESKVIKRMSQQHSAVVVGRSGFYVLREHPRILSVFLYADLAFRQERVQELYHISGPEALKLINSIDRARTRYLQTFTGQELLNACNYHICLDTSAIGLDRAEDIIITAAQARLGDIVPREEKPTLE